MPFRFGDRVRFREDSDFGPGTVTHIPCEGACEVTFDSTGRDGPVSCSQSELVADDSPRCPCGCDGIYKNHDERDRGPWPCGECGEDSDRDLGSPCSDCEVCPDCVKEASCRSRRECLGHGGRP